MPMGCGGAAPRCHGVSAALWSEESGPGDAALVVLVHGSMDRAAGLLKLSRRLDERHRVARYDRRGYGRSAPHPGPFTMDGQVADLMTVLAGRRAVVLGHSYGGNVALALAARDPMAIAGVVTYESPQSWQPWWPGSTAGAAALDADGDPADAAEQFMRRLVGDERWERLPERTRTARRREGVAMVGELRDLRRHAPWAPAAITVPVVALYGGHGAAHHRLGMAHLAEVIPGTGLVEIAGARHFGPNTHPDAVAEVIEALVRRTIHPSGAP